MVSEIEGKYPKAYEFRRLVNGYKTFDLSRGLDYTLDMGLRDLSNGKEVVKRLLEFSILDNHCKIKHFQV